MEWETLASIVGWLLTTIGLSLTGIGLIKTAKVARNTFMLQFYDRIQAYNHIHVYLQSSWPSGARGPSTPEEWSEVRQYIGLFEGLWRMVEDGAYPIHRADSDYSHRITAIVLNCVIRSEC